MEDLHRSTGCIAAGGHSAGLSSRKSQSGQLKFARRPDNALYIVGHQNTVHHWLANYRNLPYEERATHAEDAEPTFIVPILTLLCFRSGRILPYTHVMVSWTSARSVAFPSHPFHCRVHPLRIYTLTPPGLHNIPAAAMALRTHCTSLGGRHPVRTSIPSIFPMDELGVGGAYINGDKCAAWRCERPQKLIPDFRRLVILSIP